MDCGSRLSCGPFLPTFQTRAFLYREGLTHFVGGDCPDRKRGSVGGGEVLEDNSGAPIRLTETQYPVHIYLPRITHFIYPDLLYDDPELF